MAGVQNSAALLLVDYVGHKEGSWFTAFRKKKDQNVVRGSLLVSIPPKDAPTADGKPAYNYRVVGDDIMMYCSEQDVAPLTDYEFNLVSGIKSIGARYEAFVNDIMDWGSKVKVNDVVYVSLPSQQAIERTKRCRAVVRWIGLLPGEEGTKFGVELFEEQYRGAGSTNGFWRNQQLFICEDNCGLFVSLDKLAKKADFPAIKNEPSKTLSSVAGNLSSRLGPGKSSETHSQGSPSDPGSRQGPAASTRSQTQKTKTPQFKVGDRVVSYNKQQVPIHGTVKWTGGQALTEGGKMNVVGIETDISVQKEDFPIVVTGFRTTFKCDNPRHGKVVLPESLIQLEKEVVEERIKKRHEAASKEQEDSHRPFIKQDKKKMLRDARIESQALDTEEQEILKLLHEYEQLDEQLKDKKLGSTKNDSPEQRKVETAGSRYPLSSSTSCPGNESCVDPPGKYQRSSSNTYQNLPGANNLQPSDRAYAPPHSNMDHQFAMNSRVQFSHPPRYGVIRWIGNLPQITGLIAGVELEEDMKGCADGTWKGSRYFSCKHGRSFFSPVSNLRPDQREVISSPKAGNTPPLPSAQPHHPTVPTQLYREPVQPHANIAMGSAVEVGDPQDPHYGIVRWMGFLPGREELVAGIELDEDTQQCGDGYLDGVQHFKCSYGRAFFCPVMQVRPGQRFAGSASTRGLTTENPLQVPLQEPEDQQVPPSTLYVGDQRGIQGHQNSSYLDSTLFGLFALSDIFDEMFLEMTPSLTIDTNRRAISEMLWKGIVNPLRKNGVVRYESVMRMRNKLDELEKMEGIAEKKKDPEELLNILFKHIFQMPAFVLIRRPFGVDHDHSVQLFVEHDPNLKLPTVGELLNRMFKEQKISFTKIPSKLLVQVPRIGRESKICDGITPDQKLDILELTNTARVPECMFCGERSSQKCSDCSTELPSAIDGFVYFCSTCALRTHTKKSRKDHKLQDAIDADKLELYKLDLLSVICIETSHYVCFTRGPYTGTWLFFDSMANRVYNTYYIPKVTDCTRELNEWVYSGDRTRLMSTQPQQLPELVRRFTQDIYMCVYIQFDIAVWGDVEGEDKGEQGGKPLVKQQDPTGRNTSHEFDQLRREVDSLANEKKKLAKRMEELVQEKIQYTEQAARQKLELQQQIDYQQKESQKALQQLAEKEQRIHQLETERVQLQQGNQDLQQRLASAPESSVSRFTKVQIPRQDQDSWNVRRREVLIQDELGHGAWGSVHKGTFRGKQVAVKKAHRQILHKTTIDQLMREIRIMAHVQHPCLVRLIAAVVDEGVERGTQSPLLVLELLDTDLRSAYEKKVVELKRDTLVPILRDVAYALHYLHEHQEPIIHRDVSAPNVLLQQINPGVWRAKLSDFGSANLAKDSKTPAPGAIIYSAPETFPPTNPYAPLPRQTIKIDVYSYGYLLVEAISNKMPSTANRASTLSGIKQKWVLMHDIITACIENEAERRLTMTQVLEKLHAL